MNLDEAQRLARSLMDQHGLAHVPFKMTRAKTILGVCSWMGNKKTGEGYVRHIGLSSYWTEACTREEVQDTILHEIAHALAGFGHQHDAVWRARARQVGARPVACAAPSAELKARVAELAPPAWEGKCSAGHTYTMHRAPGRVKSCTRCNPRFTKQHIIRWTKDGREVPMPAKYAAELRRIETGQTVPVRRNKKPVTLEDFFNF